MHFPPLLRSAWAAAILLSGPGAHADDAARKSGFEEFARLAQANPPRPAAAPAIKPIPLSAEGTRATDTWETMFGQTTLRNVTQPALYPVLPAAGKANGTAVVIAPGGAFLSLSFDSEGLLVARYLAERGITCFVLAYRLEPTPADPHAFLQKVGARFGGAAARPRTRTDLNESPAVLQAQEDGLAAMRYVRAHAAGLRIDPRRIGFIGFSAGGITAMNVATAYDPASRPDFIGVIYGAAPERPVPRDAPPAFVALAADDALMGRAGVPIFEDWRAAGKPVELHVYAAGDHGFGMRKTGTSADNWIGHFVQWMRASELVPQ
ncbi:alpha/beta hydrolase [Telluria mixta]|uniref:Alpha/beta hydrolase n=1 Tax=Telluria mixta TaxID=34071 RepID=A0ABT2BYG8_9BURK|nr:alpha/beta hydrolase [Telluria mixta]MCS0630192.1 alpha/beta hydrolase [Telluria mixta]WEM94494.1 alpha/beta hydrolase [Telluria mixta]